MATKEEVIATGEAEMRDRVFAKMLRNLPEPNYQCGLPPSRQQHKGADFAIVEWRTEGTSADDDWWCDECELPIRNNTDMIKKGTDTIKASANGQPPRCAKCESPLVDAGQRRPVVVKVKPCLRCGVIFWDRMEV